MSCMNDIFEYLYTFVIEIILFIETKISKFVSLRCKNVVQSIENFNNKSIFIVPKKKLWNLSSIFTIMNIFRFFNFEYYIQLINKTIFINIV